MSYIVTVCVCVYRSQYIYLNNSGISYFSSNGNDNDDGSDEVTEVIEVT